jgi:MFS family permease
LGKLADTKYGEKEIMTAGFIIMGVATMILAFVTVKSVALWALLLFITRIGAAAAEIMMETYFFKTVSPRDSGVLGSFRITRPVSYFIAPAISIVGLAFLPNQYMFIIIGLMCLVAIYPAVTIRDTK